MIDLEHVRDVPGGLGGGLPYDHLQEPLPFGPRQVPPLDVESDCEFLPLRVTEVADHPQGVLEQAEFPDHLPTLVAVDQDVIGGDEEGWRTPRSRIESRSRAYSSDRSGGRTG